MYIKVGAWRYKGCDFSFFYCCGIFAGNHKRMCSSDAQWLNKTEAISAAKKSAAKLNIEYKENNNGQSKKMEVISNSDLVLQTMPV